MDQPPQQQQPDLSPVAFEPLPQRIDANKHKRRRKAASTSTGSDAAAAAAIVPPPLQPQPPLPHTSDPQQQQQQLEDPQQAAAANGQHLQAAAAAPGGFGLCEGDDSRQLLGGLQQHAAAQHAHVADAAGYRSAAVGEHKFEYLDHTADVQLHAWGSSLREAFEQVGLAMVNYMTPIDALQLDDDCTREISASGHDLHSLLFNYLEEVLFAYATEYIMFGQLDITHLDLAGFTITATGRGEKFDRSRHECGTEVKAVTYSAMQIRQEEGDAEVFVIVDI